MICNFCKKEEATVSIEHAFDGITKNIFLCEKCASKIGLNAFSSNIDISIKNLFKREETFKKSKVKTLHECPYCGQKLTDIILQSKIGCLNCFTIFEKEITDLLKKKKSDIKYTGKIPRSSNKIFDKTISTMKLKQKLDDAVKNEEYELAAIFRDELKVLEQDNV